MTRSPKIKQRQQPLMRRENSIERGRHLVASESIRKGQLIFVERPMIVMQSTGNAMQGALTCSYCMSFVGTPQQSLQISSDPMICLPAITTTTTTSAAVEDDDDDPYALIPCRHECGHVYCSIECQQDDWEYGGHKELCTGWIDDINHPLVKFKQHAVETNEIFLIVGQWLARILKQDLPYNDDDHLNNHPYTDFQMNPWWDVNTIPIKNKPGRLQEAIEIEQACTRLCEDSCEYLRQAWPQHQHNKWLTPLGLARLIGSLEQNCVGVRRKHPIRQNIMDDIELRHTCHANIITSLETAGLMGSDDDDVDHTDDCTCCTDEEAITNEEPNDETGIDSSNEKANNGNNICQIENTKPLSSSSDKEEWDYSHDDIASFLGGLEVSTDLGRDDAWDDVFVPLDGTAHFSIATKMNHSCEPNVVLLYNTNGWGKKHPLVASCVALKDIDTNEELTISYITSDDTYEDRQSALENYGFVCCCPKCQKEKQKNMTENGESNNPVDLVVKAHSNDDDDLDDVFGSDNDDVEDENDLFGSDEDDESNANDDASAQNDVAEMDGDSKLSRLAARIESCLNQSHVGNIPLAYLAPVSNQVIHDMKDVLNELMNKKKEGAKEEANHKNDNIIVDLAGKCVTAIETRDFCSCRIVGDDLESVLWRMLKSNGSFPTPSYRKSYWSAAITSSIGYAHEGSFLTAMNYLDKALMLGQSRSAIAGFFSYVEMFATHMALGPCSPAVKCRKIPTFKEQDDDYNMLIKYGLSKPISSPVSEYTGPTKDVSNYLLKGQQTTKPIVFRSLASDWPATTKWRDIGNIFRRFGHRLVPIEVGSMSMSSSTQEGGLKEELVTFREFVSKYMSPSSEKVVWSLEDAVTTSASGDNNDGNEKSHHQVAYLAQHPLLDQIQELYDDVETNPCGISPTNINSWMGTGGTRTPLHFDSYDNLFVQVVGAKYVRLYDNNQTGKLYVSNNQGYGLQGNMSEIDCELEDLGKYPLLKDCPYTEVLLLPGDCLFIPSRYWHYVRSLSTSISVNYWF